MSQHHARAVRVLPLLVALVSVLSCAEQPRVLRLARPFVPYAGSCVAHPRAKELARGLPPALDAAAARVHAQLGLRVDVAQFQYRLSDRFAGDGSILAVTVFPSGGRPPLIELGAGPLLLGLADPETVLAHELTHASMGQQLGSAHDSLPAWLREGLALHAASEGDAKIDGALAWSELSEPASLLDGLAESEHHWQDYAEDAVAMKYLIARGGDDAPRELVGRLLGGEGWQEALEDLSGESLSSFRRGTRTLGLRLLRERAGPEWEDYRAGREALTAGRHEDALQALLPLAWQGTHVLSAPAAVRAGGCLLELGRPGEAEALFAELVDGPRAGFRELLEALLGSARARVALGDMDGAGERCAEFLPLQGVHEDMAARCRELLVRN